MHTSREDYNWTALVGERANSSMAPLFSTFTLTAANVFPPAESSKRTSVQHLSDTLTVRGTSMSGAEIVSVSGELDICTQHVLLEHVASSGFIAPVLVLDLEGVTFVDARGLACIVAIRHTVMARAAELVIASARPRTVRVIRIAGLDRVLRLAPTIDTAITQSPVE